VLDDLSLTGTGLSWKLNFMSTSALVAQRRSLSVAVSPLAVPLLFSALAWGLLFVYLPPKSQDFPLNDDWAFGRGALLFASGKGIHYGSWAAMPQLGQWLWACPFIWVLGPTFFALRVSTILLSWLGLWAFYDLMRQEGLPAGRAALAVGVLAFHPLFFLLQGTFMTDVPALSLSLAALALYVRAVRQERAAWLWAACATATLAAISRQNTVTVSVVAAVLLWRMPSLRTRAMWWLGVMLPVGAGLATHFWLQHRTDVRHQKPELLQPVELLQLPFVTLHFAGLAALPLLLLTPRIQSWKTFAWALGLMLAFAGYWIGYPDHLPYGGLFPYTENMLTPQGAFVGSKMSGGNLVVGENTRPVLLGTTARVLLSLLGCVAGALLVLRVFEWVRQAPSAGEGKRAVAGTRGWRASPLVLFTILQIAFLLIGRWIFDRYLLFLLPGALFLAVPPAAENARGQARRWAWPCSVAVLVVTGMVSVALMHDWLAWNSARWQLGLRAVQQRRIDPLSIEGGFEWNGWYSITSEEPRRTPRPRWQVLRFTNSWFSWITGQYCLSFSELRDIKRLVDSQPYSLWLAPGSRQFYLLELPPQPTETRNGSSDASMKRR
jgi:hypothetical protein